MNDYKPNECFLLRLQPGTTNSDLLIWNNKIVTIRNKRYESDHTYYIKECDVYVFENELIPLSENKYNFSIF